MKHNQLGRKVLAYILLVSMVLSILMTLTQLYSDYLRSELALVERINVIFLVTEPALATSAWQLNSKVIAEQMASIGKLPDIEHVRFTATLDESFESGDLGQTKNISVTKDVTYRDEIVGTIVLTGSYEQVYEELLARFWLIFITQSLKALLGGMCIYVIIYWLITRHLVAIAAFISRGNVNNLNEVLSIRSGVQKIDELDAVVGAINQLRLSLNDSFSTQKQKAFQVQKIAAQLSEAERIAGMGSWQYNFSDRTIQWSEGMKGLLAVDKAQWDSYEEMLSEHVHPLELPRSLDKDQPIDTLHKFRILDNNNQEKWVVEHTLSILNDDGGVIARRGILQDVSHDHAHYAQIELSDAVLLNMMEGVIVADSQFNVLRTNRSYEQMTGFKANEIAGENMLFNVVEPSSLDELQGEIMSQVGQFDRWKGELLSRTKTNEMYREQRTIGCIYSELGDIEYYFSIAVDVTENKAYEDKILHQATHDNLTNLLSRSSFYDILDGLLKQSAPIAVVYIDLDLFKSINDSQGHLVGDRVLQEVARRLQSIFRSPHLVARTGGDEFVGLFLDLNEVQLSQAIHELQLSLKQPIEVGRSFIHISTSMGISLYPKDGETAEILVGAADEAMYFSKRNGRNQFRYFDVTMQALKSRRSDVKEALNIAIKEQEIYVEFQPILDANTYRVVKVEALARWHSRILGKVSPEEFISIAEEFGLIQEISAIVTRKALEGIKVINRFSDEVVGLSINRSIMEFMVPESESVRLSTMIADLEVPPEWITVEITEGMFLSDYVDSLKELIFLKDLNIKIAIDDFGIGYSSLGYLTEYPIDEVKVDKSFIQDVASNEKSKMMVKSIIGLSNNLNIKTIVEGVETQEQLDFIRNCGATMYQGYLFSSSRSAEDISDLIFSRKEDNATALLPSSIAG